MKTFLRESAPLIPVLVRPAPDYVKTFLRESAPLIPVLVRPVVLSARDRRLVGVPPEAIRDLLARVAHGYMGLPAGHVAAPFGHVEAHGGDVEAVRTWVEAHGGWVENPAAAMRRRLRPGQVVEPASPNRTQFVIPASALEPEP